MSSDNPHPKAAISATVDEGAPNPSDSIWEQSVIPENPSPQLRTVLEFIHGLQSTDYPFVSTLMTSDFLMCILPQSLGVPCRPKEEWLEKCKRSSLLWPGTFRVSSFARLRFDELIDPEVSNGTKLDITDINESPGKVWIHGIGSARAKTGKGYENECLMMFKLTDGKESPDGVPRIYEMKEFMDSLYISNWAAEVGKTLSQIK